MSQASLLRDLSCPITLDVLEDPISVPCCGKAFSRASLLQHIAHSCRCPCCNGNLDHFDASNAPKNVVLSSLIESLSKPSPPRKEHTWSCEFSPVVPKETMGELKIMLEDSNFATRPSLFIAVLDRSGSMSGRPVEQVAVALKHIESLAAVNDQVKLVMLSYGSDCFEIESASKYFISGGTNFRAAFNCISTVLRRYVCSEDPKDLHVTNNVSSVTIAFLTDGADGSGNREALIPEFRSMLQARWNNHPLTVHTIGFGVDCDRDLLEGMREAGSLPGMFRYAEQEDNDDLLCNKLTGIFETSSKASSVTIELTYGSIKENIRFPINRERYGEFCSWVRLPASFSSISISSCLEKNTCVPIMKKPSSTQVKDRWVAKCVDNLASKLLTLCADSSTLSAPKIRKLHCGLLQSEVDALQRSTHEEATHNRLSFLSQQIRLLQKGKALHIGKLSDMRFSSIFKENIADSRAKIHADVAPNFFSPPALSDKPYFELPLRRYGHNNEGKGRNALQEAIMEQFSDTLPDSIDVLIGCSSLDDICHTDCHGNNALMLACYSGLSTIAKTILAKYGKDISLETKNDFDETALTLAIKRRGFHHTVGVLLDAGAELIRKASLERFAIDNGYTITAEIISNSSSESFYVDESMTKKYVQYLFNKAVSQKADINGSVFLSVCLSKMMENEVVILLSDPYHVKPSFDMLVEYCLPKKADAPDTDDYLRLSALLLEKNPSLVDEQHIETGDTPLITAVRKGSLPHVQYFLEAGASLEKTNAKGNTALWVASFMRYPCIITDLIHRGADVNLENLKGNPPLYGPCCRGGPKVAEQLISYGADVFTTNQNGDTLILICCRNGQSEVLQALLPFVDEEFVNMKAHIDGFNAIMACAEQDKGTCLQVLSEYGIDVNQKTDDDNAILGGATPLHIACYYGRLSAASVLLKLGAQVNAKDVGGNTPLHLAVMQGFIDIVLLLRSKADVSLTNNAGNTAAAYCRDREEIRAVLINPMLDILNHLAKGGFSKEEEDKAINLLQEYHDIPGCLTTKEVVDIIDHDGSTPLQNASLCGNYNVAKVLCSCKADPRIANQFGLNSIDLAQWTRNRRILQLFDATDSEKDSIPFKRLTTASKSDPRNAPLLFLGRRPNSHEIFKNSGISQRMQSFLNTPIYEEQTPPPPVLAIAVPNSQIQTCFQSKDAGMDEIGKSLMFWEAKCLLMNKVGAGEVLLTPPELLALAMFINNTLVPSILNATLLGMREEIQLVNNYNGLLMSTLQKLPPFNAECFIGSADVDRKLFLKGTEFQWQHFVSSSVMWKVALENTPSFTSKAHKGVIFVVKSKSGRLVRDYSSFPSDVEVILLPGVRYKVTRWYHGDVIALGQENIREHTFGVKDIDTERLTYADLQTSDKAIIIEITEQ